MNSFIRLLLVVLCALALFETRSNAASLSIGLAEEKVSIDTQQLSITPEEAAKWDPAKYYVDTSLGFTVRKPASEGWSAPELLEGVAEYLEAKKAVMNQERIERLHFTMQTHPLGPMLRGVEAIRYTTNETLLVELTDETTNEVAEEAIRNTIESEQILELNLGDREIEKLKKNIRRSAVSFEETAFVNEFSVYVYNKKRLLGRPVAHSLAGFSIFILGQTAPVLDRLVADEHAVLAGGTVAVRRVLVNGEIGNFRAERVYMCTESKDRYYFVEIGFSPQTKNSQRVWNDFAKMLRSFAVLDER